MQFYGYKEKDCEIWQLRVHLLKPMKFCLVNKILVSLSDYCLQVLVAVRVGSVSLNEPNTRMRLSDIFSCDCSEDLNRTH